MTLAHKFGFGFGPGHHEGKIGDAPYKCINILFQWLIAYMTFYCLSCDIWVSPNT